MSSAKTILTGIKPTGTPHIGNYLGAIAPALHMANGPDNCYFFIEACVSRKTWHFANDLNQF